MSIICISWFFMVWDRNCFGSGSRGQPNQGLDSRLSNDLTPSSYIGSRYPRRYCTLHPFDRYQDSLESQPTVPKCRGRDSGTFMDRSGPSLSQYSLSLRTIQRDHPSGTNIIAISNQNNRFFILKFPSKRSRISILGDKKSFALHCS